MVNMILGQLIYCVILYSAYAEKAKFIRCMDLMVTIAQWFSSYRRIVLSRLKFLEKNIVQGSLKMIKYTKIP